MRRNRRGRAGGGAGSGVGVGSALGQAWPLALPAAVAVLFLLLPLAGLLVRAPWSSLPRVLAEARALEALRLSVVTASLATLLSLVLGGPSVAAWSGERPCCSPQASPRRTNPDS